MEITFGTVHIREFNTLSVEYTRELELRDLVLRRPLGMSIYKDDLTPDASCIHLGAFVNQQLAGVLLLAFLPGRSLKMRQFAVLPEFQKSGIGTLLVHSAEDIARKRGYNHICMHARRVAEGFYLKLGYVVSSNEFTEVGIPHVEMEKHL